MKQETLKRLVHAAQKELPTLKVDAGNASTHHALMPVCEHLVSIMGVVVRALIENEVGQQTVTGPAPFKPAPHPTPTIPHPATVESVPPLPEIPDLDAPRSTAPAAAGLPPDAPFVPGVTNAFVTPQGIKVIEPNGKVVDAAPPAPTQNIDVM